ncbi:MAG: ATP-binding cassette domain-containing protein [Anaerolineae bacterium]|nr:ATP-binding cassette domain-containing protein [Anaerolineae bacterium]
MTGQSALIEVRGLVKVFKTPAGSVTVLKGINLDFNAGEFVGIVGKSGSGKSTLVNMITGIDHPTEGSVRAGDVNLHSMREGELAVWRGRNMGVIFQFFQLLPMLTVLENVLLPMDLAKLLPFEKREERAMTLLEQVGAAEVANKLPGALSGGQQQIAAIARALANDPPILVADEPTGNLDTATADVIFSIFQELARQGKTILFVTHDMTLANRADRKVILSDGELVNEHLAAAFPTLTHPQLLQLTHLADRRRISPGENLAGDHSMAAGLLIALEGEIELLTSSPTGKEKKIRLTPGQYIFHEAPPGETTFQLVVSPEVAESAEALIIQAGALESWLKANPSARLALQEKAANLVDFQPAAHRRRGSRRLV